MRIILIPRARTLLALLVLTGLLAGACGGDDAADDGRIDVVASFYPLAEMAARVGGDAVSVTNLTGAGTEPHELELTSRQVDRIESADVVLYLGRGFQPSVEAAAKRTQGTRLDVLSVVEPIAGSGDEVDPHFWLDPARMKLAARAVERALSEVVPDGEALAENARRYVSELGALDAEMAAALAICARRQIVTTHAAFSYLAERYDLEQLAISGLSPEAEPDPQRLSTLSDQIAREGITTVFYETLVSPAVADALAREAHVRTAVLDPIEGLSPSRLERGDDYAAVMRENLAALEAALSCTVPAQGTTPQG